MKFILVTDGTWGDTLPFVFLAKEIKANNDTVLLMTNEFYKEYLDKEEIQFKKTTGIEDREEFLKNKNLWDHKKGMEVIGRYSGIMFEKSLKTIETEILKGVDVIVSHAFCYGAKTMAEKYRIPYICLLISPIQIKSNYRLPVFYGGKNINYLPHIIKKFLYPLINRYVIDTHFPKRINEVRKKMNLSKITSFVFWCTKSDLTIGLWPSWYLPLEIDQGGNHLCGFPKMVEVNEENTRLFSWIKSGEKPILVTLGSGHIFSEKILGIIEQLAEYSTERFIFLGPNHNTVSKDQNINKVFITDRIKLSKILPFCKIAIHHGGAGTLAQVILAGIPHIVIPQSHDQPDNAWIIQNNKLGQVIWGEISCKKISSIIKNVLHSEEIYLNCKFAKDKISADEDGIRNTFLLIKNYMNSNI